ncbi:MAG TPA: nuclear transport factor 2 family protein [Tepidisphaeraceae bacterium]|nr:nuclear transport factor 2 family protein [Tepidisphaeraceae bacterium]
MKTEEVAKKLVAYCQKMQFNEAIEALYSPDIVSVEAFAMPGGQMPREMKGIDAVRKKTEWWETNHTVHSFKTSEPFLAEDKFAVIFDIDVTHMPSGKKNKMSEVAVYTVSNGKIVREEFLYRSQGNND